MAARRTERCSDQATRPRQAKTARAKKPSTPPTQMKTVPSGREDFCMNGAAEVSGTMMVGIDAPGILGRSSAAEDEAIVGRAPPDVAAAEPVVVAVVLASVDCDF